MNVNPHFLEDEDVEGISFLQNVDWRQKLLRKCCSKTFQRHSPLSLHCHQIKKEFATILGLTPHVVAPKPIGIRYLLNVNLRGRMFMMQSSTQHFFQVDLNYIPHLIPTNTILDGILVRRIVGDFAAHNINNPMANGRLTYVIMDAIRCHGVNLTRKTLQERMSTVEVCYIYFYKCIGF